ncbi:MAG: HupE/UreJ family protein [Planctomycetota bacterium]|nr:MAG: HupE/UreJ family protein [Planctomycetota bacterium]
MLAALLVAPLVALVALAAHPNSISSSRVRVPPQRDRALVEIVCEAATLCEAVPIDRDGDRRLDAAELEAGWNAVRDYVAAHYSVRWCDERETAPAALTGSLVSLAESNAAARAGASDVQWIELELEYPSARVIEGLRIEFRLFYETNPAHMDFCEVAWEGEPPTPWKFNAENDTAAFYDARLAAELDLEARPNMLAHSLVEGVLHILTGWDHLCFLLALLVASRGVRALLWTITAFTLAHSITLALAALDVLRVPSSWVEPAIALSIAYVAALNLWWRRPRAPWTEALGFGLIHGLGFAGLLSELLLDEPQKLRVLIGFNLGVELGQIAVVAALLGVFEAVRRVRAHSRAASSASAPGASLAPAPLDRWLSWAVLFAGLYWFVDRMY